MVEKSNNPVCNIDFSSKKCKPCEGKTPPLNSVQAKQYLQSIQGWELFEDSKIKKEFKFKNFPEAIGFVNNVA